MAEGVSLAVRDADFEFENTSVKMIASRSCPEIKVAGETIGPLEEGREFEVKYWVARELVKAGLARFHGDDLIDLVSLHKIHWREMIQTGRQISTLPENFYPKLRRYLAELKQRAASETTHAEEYNKALRIAQDIVNCRLKKIVGLASSPAQTDSVLRSLSREERFLYDHLYFVTSNWKSKIVKLEVSG